MDRAVLEEVDPQSVAAADDIPCPNAELAKELDAGLTDVVGGDAGDEFGLQPEVGQ